MAAETTIIPNILGTNRNLIPLPTSPGFRSGVPKLIQRASSNPSVYTGSPQVLQWPGADFWTAAIEMPSLSRSDAAEWTATLESLCGVVHAFQLGNQMYQGPRNPDALSGAVPVVDGTTSVTNAVGTRLLAVRGYPADSYNVQMRGDYLQIGYRYYRVTAPVTSDDNGKAVLSIAPGLRELHSDGSALDIVTPVGVFVLTEQPEISSSYTGMTTVSFKCMELR